MTDDAMILCCGDALIDMLPRALPDGARAFLPTSGGAVFNTAVALGRLGAPTGFLAGLSVDMFGQQLQQDLDEAGVDSSFCVRSERPTTLAFVELVGGNARYRFYDEGSAGRMLSPGDLPALPDTIEALHFGGISLVGEPSGSAYEALTNRENGRRLISLDPNIRATMIADEASHRARIRRLIGKADIVKVSDEDLAWIEPFQRAEDTIQSWIAGGTSIVILTSGGAGAAAYSAAGEVIVRPSSVEVVDTVGAGDCFVAGFLASLYEQGVSSKTALASLGEQATRESLEFATKVASIVVTRAGANPPWRAEID